MAGDYTIEHKGGRVLVHGAIPVDEFAALQKMWAKRGIDTLALRVSTALGATFAACRKDDVDAWTAEVAVRAVTLANGDAELEWLLGPDTGTSSKTIFSVLASSKTLRARALGTWRANTPSDPSDFGRCHRLLERFPAWRDRLGEVAEAHPKWTRLVDAWGEMTALWLKESPTGRCPKLYDLMKSLGA